MNTLSCDVHELAYRPQLLEKLTGEIHWRFIGQRLPQYMLVPDPQVFGAASNIDSTSKPLMLLLNITIAQLIDSVLQLEHQAFHLVVTLAQLIRLCVATRSLNLSFCCLCRPID